MTKVRAKEKKDYKELKAVREKLVNSNLLHECKEKEFGVKKPQQQGWLEMKKSRTKHFRNSSLNLYDFKKKETIKESKMLKKVFRGQSLADLDLARKKYSKEKNVNSYKNFGKFRFLIDSTQLRNFKDGLEVLQKSQRDKFEKEKEQSSVFLTKALGTGGLSVENIYRQKIRRKAPRSISTAFLNLNNKEKTQARTYREQLLRRAPFRAPKSSIGFEKFASKKKRGIKQEIGSKEQIEVYKKVKAPGYLIQKEYFIW